jgi:hypothetical protein
MRRRLPYRRPKSPTVTPTHKVFVPHANPFNSFMRGTQIETERKRDREET